MHSRKKLAQKENGDSCFLKAESGSEVLASLIFSNRRRKKQKQKLQSPVKARGLTLAKRMPNNSTRKRLVWRNSSDKEKLINLKVFRHKKIKRVPKKLSSPSSPERKLVPNASDENVQNTREDVKVKKLRRKRKKKIREHFSELDEASRLQRRTRYLLVKMKLEQNLIDAYSGEGWKGQSREKIKPIKELQRARKQILNFKLGIRDAIRQLDSISSVGSIEGSVIAPDGSVHHEHIFCSKCKTNETFPDNDIILCDGTCNCAFHQKCLDPPLETESIPPGDQGWFCRFCECKMEIIESTNAHLGTHFSLDSNWQDIFKEEAALPDGGIQVLDLEEKWPSDDSGDDDYDPKKMKSTGISCAGSDDSQSYDTSSSTSLSWSLDGEILSGPTISGKGGFSYPESIAGSDVLMDTDMDTVCGPRQRNAVDYKQLYNEMFGKDTPACEQASEDEDWGPNKRRRRERETDAASTLMTLYESEKNNPFVDQASEGDKKLSAEARMRRRIFRIPPTAVEKLRQVFAENELPSRSVKENLAKEFGLEPEKVSKWFKNARYMALKTRKAGGDDQSPKSLQVHTESELAKMKKGTGTLLSKDASTDIEFHSSRSFEKVVQQKSTKSLHKKGSPMVPEHSYKENSELDDNMSLKQIKLLKGKPKDRKRVDFAANEGLREREAQLQELGKIKSRLDSLRKRIFTFQSSESKASGESNFCGPCVVYVPVAELKERA
ncbi:pathogenesis-related homeodomain protein isoform X2 [Rhodamnia argentea]|uniref:Pathogenesis-related homeodomain protein isoform X2 n=1 Tax=Rhodamnia argentea TaxID=178133 RepID=A0A8B8PMR1_9MYRT|nr:pathogenesis-related homeodomain protein isoform X2 [Rhodamnia argentea]